MIRFSLIGLAFGEGSLQELTAFIGSLPLGKEVIHGAGEGWGAGFAVEGAAHPLANREFWLFKVMGQVVNVVTEGLELFFKGDEACADLLQFLGVRFMVARQLPGTFFCGRRRGAVAVKLMYRSEIRIPSVPNGCFKLGLFREGKGMGGLPIGQRLLQRFVA